MNYYLIYKITYCLKQKEVAEKNLPVLGAIFRCLATAIPTGIVDPPVEI